MQFTYKVDVEVERDSGLNASRDDISELIEEEISSAESNLSLTGLGPNDNSDYSVVSFEVTHLDNKEQRAFNAQYDEAAIADLPGDAELRKRAKLLAAENKGLIEANRKLGAQIEALKTERAIKATRIYQDNVGSGLPPTYFEDGPYDRVIFQYGDGDYDRFTVALKEDKIEIRSDGMGVRDMALFPRSGNEIMIGMVTR